MIHPTFRNINKLFTQSFKASENDLTRNYFHEYYIPWEKSKSFNAIIDKKPLFDVTVKNKQEAYENLVETSRKKWVYNSERIRLFAPSKTMALIDQVIFLYKLIS